MERKCGKLGKSHGERMRHLGVRHGREYHLILKDLTEALTEIEDSYTFFEMTDEDWGRLNKDERTSLLEALADDVFYGLGGEPRLRVGGGDVTYDPKYHVIKVGIGEKLVRIVHLV